MIIQKFRYVVPAALLLVSLGCNSNFSTPKDLLDLYFSSAVKQDYAKTYTCYYSPYKAKFNSADYVKHRKDASVLQSYQIASIRVDGNKAQAEALLTFAPSQRMNRKEPVTVKVKEDMVKEGNEWKIKVW